MSVNQEGTLIITKRDGSTEAFSTSKLRRGMEALLGGAGFDSHLATPLAKAVSLHIHRCDDESPLTSAYIFDCVHAVLSQTGLRDAADAFRAHQQRRRTARGRISVCGLRGDSEPTARWDKARLVASLSNKFGLQKVVSRYLAGEIENKVIAMDYQSVSRELLSALVRNELSSWGLLDGRSADACAAVAGRQTESPPDKTEDRNASSATGSQRQRHS